MDRKMIEGVRAALNDMAEFEKAQQAAKAAEVENHANDMFEGLDDDDKDTLMKVAKKLKKASATHDKQSKSIMKDLEDDTKKEEKEMDPVDPKAAAKKFKDRKDKDIDNDGDVDSSDEYLHKRRKAIGKTMKKEDTDIRGKLMSIWEAAADINEADRAAHYKGATKPENMPKDDARSDKKMIDAHPMKKHGKGEKEDPESKKAEDSTKPSPMRGNDKKQGDKAIMKSATPDHPAHKTTKEQVDSIKAAYESMYEKEDENGS